MKTSTKIFLAMAAWALLCGAFALSCAPAGPQPDASFYDDPGPTAPWAPEAGRKLGAFFPQPTGTGLGHLTSGEWDPTAYTLVGADIPWTSAHTIGWASGQVPGFGAVVINFASNANLTLSSSQYNNLEVRLTDTTPVLTTGRNVVFPLQSGASAGATWIVANATLQTLTAIGDTDTGAGVQIPAGSASYVYVNAAGTQMHGMAGTVGNGWIANEEGSGGVVMPIPGTQMTLGAGSIFPVRISVNPASGGGSIPGSNTWTTLAAFTVATNTLEFYSADVYAGDYSGASTTVTGDFSNCTVKFTVTVPNSGVSGTLITAQNGTAGPSATVALTGANCTSVVSGVASNGPGPFSFQALYATGVVSLQAEQNSGKTYHGSAFVAHKHQQ